MARRMGSLGGQKPRWPRGQRAPFMGSVGGWLIATVLLDLLGGLVVSTRRKALIWLPQPSSRGVYAVRYGGRRANVSFHGGPCPGEFGGGNWMALGCRLRPRSLPLGLGLLREAPTSVNFRLLFWGLPGAVLRGACLGLG